MEKIKNCPFCGGKAEFEYREKEDDGMGYVVCVKCDVKIFGTKENAIKQWNKRIK